MSRAAEVWFRVQLEGDSGLVYFYPPEDEKRCARLVAGYRADGYTVTVSRVPRSAVPGRDAAAPAADLEADDERPARYDGGPHFVRRGFNTP